jgi:tripartite-type tricarboxylate transporter receptor subunit TctC
MLAATTAAIARSARGQPVGWPARALRIIVPVAAGGSQDIVARLTARCLTDSLGQPVLVENQPSAAGNVAFEMVVRARPDGYMLIAGSDSLSINGALYPRLAFDPVADFEAVVQSVRAPLVLAVRADAPFADFADLLASARSGPVAVGTNGNGTLGHLLGEVLQAAAETRWTHVPYRGGALAINDLLGGTLQAIIVYSGAVADHIRAGRMRGLLISSANRARTLPMVPSLPEAGHRGAEIVGWHGLAAPRSTDPLIITRLNREVRAAFALPEVAERIAGLGLEPVDAPPEALAARIRVDAARWAEVIRRGRVQPD